MPFPTKSLVGLDEGDRRRRGLALWRTMCDEVDPAIRRALRPSAGMTFSDARTGCGAMVVLVVLYTGEGEGVAAPDTISGAPVSAETHGDTSVVTVDVRYTASRPSSAPPPPARARVKVLAIRRDGRWWVATPRAFNANVAAAGGMTERQLRASHRELLAKAG